ncbi:AAA family ATPase [Nicoliella lavandulae]|uniref:AAA family ATPase n=1 Tax=Nicoliella lavandulae TaxID=3082954 RepID=A0ABU8SP35_9LACO
MQLIKASNIVRQDSWKMLVYAKAGVGKTSLIRDLPGKTLVLDLDNSSRVLSGLDNVTVASIDRSQPIEDVASFMKQFKSWIEKGNFDNLVIDNVSSFEKDWFTEQARKSSSQLSNQIQDYSAWTNYFNRWIASALSVHINVLITAWESTRKFVTSLGQEVNRYVPEVRDAVMDSLIGHVDVCGRMMISQKPGSEGKRFILLEGNDNIYAKNRLDDRKAAQPQDLFPQLKQADEGDNQNENEL